MRYVIIITITAATLSAAVWSKTMIDIATGQLSPFVSSQMSGLTARVTQINTKYSAQIKTEMDLKDSETLAIRSLETEILLELKKINFEQRFLNLEVAK
ncbi:MAG: hypothetical protein PHO62_07940 [Sulfurimonas sp.]|uniref:hypothetical protein n=1 Tax=Sulfurimonas sp. TaxID=2022749 RepID=UPI002633666A|nr:hypothetical protein [Sulfurimonas sp.]MDD5373338.1 hypothetical protein [Sulfurimonas sp.]